MLPAVPELLQSTSLQNVRDVSSQDCRALLDTGADGTSITRALADAAGLAYRGKSRTTGISGETFRRSWTTFLGMYSEEELGQLPFLLPEPVLAIEMTPYPKFDVILGRDILMLGDFILKANGDFELSLPSTL